MKTKILIGLGALSLLVVAGAAWAHGHRGGMMGHMISQRIADAEDYVDATPQQRAVIDQEKESIVAIFKAQHQAQANTHGQIAALLAGASLNAQQIHALVAPKPKGIQDLAAQSAQHIAKAHDP